VLGQDSKLDRAFLNVKHSVGDIALLEHVLILMEFQYRLSRAHFGEKVCQTCSCLASAREPPLARPISELSAPNCCRASGIVCDLEEVPDRSLILGNRVVIARRPNLWGPRGRSRYLILVALRGWAKAGG
jgi:hypothetical protein